DLAGEAGDVTMDEYRKHLVYASDRLRVFPISFISASTGENVLSSLSMLKVLDANLDLKVPTPFLNKLMEKNDPSRVPVPRKKKRPNFLYITQTSRRPIEFTVFVNEPGAVVSAHLRFIENVLRDNLPLKGISVRIRVRASRAKRQKK
ncbi:MAG: hypothetical protein KAS86_02510, partial [Candidatus Omnitrophica bacterium]|nr:hypothetical protein [Candidatus Omnitrophota bacterium]